MDDANIWHVEALDANGDGHEEIVHSNAGGQLLVRDGNGEVIARYFTGSYVSHFVLTRWGSELQPTHILVPTSESRGSCCKDTFVILDALGKKVAELDSPLGHLFHRFSATPIRFEHGAENFAVLEDYPPGHRSMLLLYGNDGQTVYQEILGESCLGMAAFPSKDGETLLVGCSAKIWEYASVPRTNNSSPNDKVKANRQ